jgi:hypothetical protein
MVRSNGPSALVQKVGVAAAVGAALTGGCSSSDSGPESQTSSDAGGAGGAGNDALSETFDSGTPEDVAQELEAMVDAGSGGYAGWAPSYKGVTFT